MTFDRIRRLLLPAAVLVTSFGLVLWQYVLRTPATGWQVDLDVYRNAGASLLTGRPLYDFYTAPPQLLPSTYPPFAAILAMPLALMSMPVAAWVWNLLQVGAVLATTWYAGSPLWRRCERHGVLAWAVLTAVLVWTWPVKDGFRFGQVDAFLVLACLLDVLRPRVVRWLPQGVCIGLATAIKLTPGVFIVHLLLTRQWRAAWTAIATAGGVTLAAFLLLPEASFAFWGGALQDPQRLGANDNTANQSIRGVLQRLLGLGALSQVVWLVLAGLVAVGGFWLAHRAHTLGQPRAQVAIVGLVAFLISPVSWIHHLEWVLVVVPVLLGTHPLRDRARMALAGLVVVLLVLNLPWWGQWPMVIDGADFPQHRRSAPWWELLNNADCLIAAGALAAIGWVLLRRPRAE